MAKVVVTPEEFSYVKFDAAHIAELTGKIADKVGLPADIEIRVDIDEGSPLGRTRLESLDPVTISVEGGAFEDAKRPRTLSDQSVIDVVGRLLFRAKDRLDPSFADAPADDELTLQQHTAWDTYAVGRCERAGWAPQKKRRIYHFRNRHGFTDVADGVFDRLWNGDGLTWADLDAACAETDAARTGELAMVVQQDFTATRQDTVVVVHDGYAVVTTTLELNGGAGTAETVERVVVELDGNQGRLELTVPEPQLEKDSPWVATVLLPVGATFVPGDPEDDNGEIDGFAVLDVPSESRPVVVWWGHKDPKLPILWTLLR